MHKIKPGALTAGAVKSNFKETIEKFVARDNAFFYEHSQRDTSILETVFV